MSSLYAKGQIDHALLEAIKNCDTPAVQQRLATNSNINAADSNGANALMWAVYYCDVPLVKQLVRNGAKAVDTGVIYVDAQTGDFLTSLQGIAAAKGKLELLNYLADSLHLPLDEREYDPNTRKKDSWTPLYWAINSGQVHVVHYLLKKGANVDIVHEPGGTSPLILAALSADKHKDWRIFNLLLQDERCKAKLGEETGEIRRAAAGLAWQGTAGDDWNKDLALQQLIGRLRRIYFGAEHFVYASSLNYLAYLHHLLGRYELALPLYEEAKGIAKKTLGETHHFYAGIIHNLAYLYKAIGQDEKALSYLEQATAIARKKLGTDNSDYATSLQSLASFYKDAGQYEKALPLLQQAAAIRKKLLGEEHSDYALSLLELADLYRQMGMYQKALPLYQQVIAIRKKVLGEEHPFYARSLYHLALYHQQIGEQEKALPLLEQVVTIRRKALGEEHPDYAQSLSSLAVLYQDLKQYDKALALFSDASTIMLRHLARTYATLSEQEKLAILAKQAVVFGYLPSLIYIQDVRQSAVLQQVYANELALKGMVLEDQKAVLNSIRNRKDSTALQLYKQWHANKVFLGKQWLLPVSQQVANLDSLEEATNLLEQQLSSGTTAFRMQRIQLTATDIAQQLKKGEAAIEFVSFRVYNRKWLDSILYAALVLLPEDSSVHFVPLFEEKQLQRLLHTAADATAYRAVEQLYGKKTQEKACVADSLYQLIWKPLERYLQGTQTVYYAPAGLLHRIAFQALPADAAGLLLEKYQLHQLLSTRSLIKTPEIKPQPLTASIWGNITYSSQSSTDKYSIASRKTSTRSRQAADRVGSSFNLYTWDTRKIRGAGAGWKPLPSTQVEIDSLNTVFTQAGIAVAKFSGLRATEEAFKAMSGRSPHVLHLATHGFFLPFRKNRLQHQGPGSGGAFMVQQNPMFRSGLVLAGGNHAWKGEPVAPGGEDGILTAYEIAQMDLTGTGLVVLSACETALGDVNTYEGVIGLQRALKMAGVKQMIVSLWQVPDKATMELMTRFYQNWLGGLSPRQALQNAQLQIKEKYKHPYFWAAFVLVE